MISERSLISAPLSQTTVARSSVLDLSLLDFVQSCPQASIRLLNTIKDATEGGSLPYRSVREYIYSETSSWDHLLALPGLGRTTLAELDTLVSSISTLSAYNGASPSTTKMSDATVVHDQEITLIDFLEGQPHVSVRLMNAMRRAIHEGICPFATLAQYFAAGASGALRLCSIPNLGLNSAREFDALARSAFTANVNGVRGERGCLEHAAVTRPPDGRISLNTLSPGLDLDPDASKISLFEFLARQPRVSTRLFNVLRQADDEGTCPFEDVGDYLRAGRGGRARLATLPNLGRNSVEEFDRLLREAVATGALSSTNHTAVMADGFPNLAFLLRAVFDSFNASESKIISARLNDKRTLEEIAVEWNVTRERIRQIEARALRRLTPLASRVELATTAIKNFLKQNATHECQLDELAQSGGCSVDEFVFFLQLARKLRVVEAETFVVVGDNVHLGNMFVPKEEWNGHIRDALVATPWPIELEQLANAISQVPRASLIEHLERAYSAKVVAGRFTSLPQLSTHDMCIAGLLHAGKPLHVSELRASVMRTFGQDIAEHAIAAHVGRSTEVTICDPGTYVHYENIPYSSELLSDIRNKVFRCLHDHGAFVGSQVIFNRVFSALAAEYPDNFNHYLMMGIVQDDKRFVSKRGNMVGLSSFDLEETYVSLEDEVKSLVMNHGPLSINEVMDRLSATRKLCSDQGVRNILSQSTQIVRTGPRTFDSVARFFSSREEYDDYILAVKVSLAIGRKGSYALAEELEGLGLTKATQYVVESLLAAIDHSTLNDVYELQMDDEMAHYSAIARDCHDRRLSKQSLIEQLAEAGFGVRATRLAAFDRRFAPRPQAPGVVESGSELGSILNAFGF